MIPIIKNLLNSGSKSMNVDGTTPKSFLYTASQPIALLGLSCVLKDDGTTSFNKFGAITALTNGLLLQLTIGGVTTEITTIKDNADLCNRFHFNQFGNGAVLSILGVGTPQGFGDTNDAFIGFMEFNSPIYPILQSGDTIEAIVQDNLTNIDLLEIAAKIYTE